MIRTVTRCPYCLAVAAVDDDTAAVVLSPDTASGDPCPHLALLWVSLEAYRAGECGTLAYEPGRSGDWVWEHGSCLRRHRGKEDWPLTMYLLDLCHGCLEPHEEPSSVPCRTVRGDADERERRERGSGYFTIRDGTHEELQVELHAWAVYAPAPGAFIDVMRRAIE